MRYSFGELEDCRPPNLQSGITVIIDGRIIIVLHNAKSRLLYHGRRHFTDRHGRSNLISAEEHLGCHSIVVVSKRASISLKHFHHLNFPKVKAIQDKKKTESTKSSQ